MLNFDYRDGKVVVTSVDNEQGFCDCKGGNGWKNLDHWSRKLWSKCYWIGISGSQLVDDELTIDKVSWGQLKSLQNIIRFEPCGKYAKFTKAFMDHAADLKDAFDAEEKVKQEERARQEYINELKSAVEYAQGIMKDGCGWCSEKYYDREQRCQMCKYACKPVRFRDEDIEWQYECQHDAKVMGIECEYFAPAYPVVGCKWLVQGQEALEKLREMGEA